MTQRSSPLARVLLVCRLAERDLRHRPAAAALLAIPAGIGLFIAVAGDATLIRPPTWWLLSTVLGAVVAIAALTVIPSRLGARRPVAEILGSELA
ncbi:MAG: hypothetical protein ACRDPY_49895 [Streptosporangiaceae bacterium]